MAQLVVLAVDFLSSRVALPSGVPDFFVLASLRGVPGVGW